MSTQEKHWHLVVIGLFIGTSMAVAKEPGMVKTGDALVFKPRQLIFEKVNRVIPDVAAPGGEALERVREGNPQERLVALVTIPPVSAGRYRITVRAAIATRPSARHVGRLVIQSVADPALNETVSFGTCDFAKAGHYREFSLETVQPPVKDGQVPLTVLVEQEDPAIALRIAGIEVKAVAVAPVLVHKVWPEKLLARCRTEQPINIGVSNITDTEQRGLKLRLELFHNAGQAAVVVGEKDLALRPYQTREVVFPWNTGDPEYGYEARATVLDAQGRVVSRLSEYFSVSRSHYKLRIISSPCGNMWWLDRKAGELFIKSMRKNYQNYFEQYAFPPCNLVEMYPRHRFWSSGQISIWVFDRQVVKANVALMHRLGLWATAYEISIYTGWPGQEFMRQHPELCAFEPTGRPQGGINTALWQTQANAYGDDRPPVATSFKAEFPNNGYVWPVDDTLMRRIADEIVLIHEKLGFDAVRWDGHPAVWVIKDDKGNSIPGTGFGSMFYNHEGKKVTDVIPNGDLDRQSLHNMKLIKERVRQAAPAFEWGYNEGYNLADEQQHQTWHEVVRDAGIWVEGGFTGSSARQISDPTNTWAIFMDKLWLSSQMVIRDGGYPIHGSFSPESEVMRKFLLLVFWAQGSHPSICGQTWGEWSDYARFATRYSQYLFDPRLRPVLEPDPDIHVTGWIQWQDRNAGQRRPLDQEVKIQSPRPVFFPDRFLFMRTPEAGKQETILHLINPPLKSYLDLGEPDYPPPQDNIQVDLRAPAGMKAKTAWCLSPDTWPMEMPLTVRAAAPGWIRVTVPKLTMWDVLVVSWEKE